MIGPLVMHSFTFDESAGFDANLEEFIHFLERGDPQMGQIFRAIACDLTRAGDDSTRRAACEQFNNKARIMLDELAVGEAET